MHLKDFFHENINNIYKVQSEICQIRPMERREKSIAGK
jgi:hypothetical protein